MKKMIVSLSLMGALFAGNALADNKDITAALNKIGVPTTGIKISDTPISGLKSALTSEGIFYVSNDGKYLSQGPIYDVQGSTPSNIANATNISLINSIAKDAIAYKAANEKYVVSVFTDVTCSYCKKLHEQVADYNKQGITIRYFAYPRQGLDSPVAKDMQSIWSTADRKQAFENAYKGSRISPANSMVPFVRNHYQVGRQLGISGTPAIVLADGQLISGYVPPEELKNMLDQHFNK